MIERVVAKWHAYLSGGLPGGLDELLDDDVVFHSPIVYTPQRGKAITTRYLEAAASTFAGSGSTSGATPTGGKGAFHYTKTLFAEDTAALEFETTMQGTFVNGIDIIRCNQSGRIVEFRVMIRPLQAVTMVHQQMAAMLEAMAGD